MQESLNCFHCQGYRTNDPKKLFKCCVYEPFLANFLLGKSLCEGLIGEAELVGGEYCALGFIPQRMKQKNYKIQLREARDLSAYKCRFYELSQQSCSIWPNNGAVCSNYFCKSDQGVKGQRYWLARKDFYWQLEFVQAQWLAEEVNGGLWRDKDKSSFYKACYEAYKALDFDQCLAINPELKNSYGRFLKYAEEVKDYAKY